MQVNIGLTGVQKYLSDKWKQSGEKIEITPEIQCEIDKLDKVIELRERQNKVFIEKVNEKNEDREKYLQTEYIQVTREIRRLMTNTSEMYAEDYKFVILNGKAKTIVEAHEIVINAYKNIREA